MIVRPFVSALLLLALAATPVLAATGTDRRDASLGRDSAVTAPSQPGPSIAALLKECHLEYTEAAPATFTLNVPGKRTPRHKLFVASYEGLVLVGTIVAKKADVPKSADLASRLLRFNHDFDRVKVALDEDGDLVVRVDLSLRLLDAAELRTNVDQVAASADEILSLIQSVGAK